MSVSQSSRKQNEATQKAILAAGKAATEYSAKFLVDSETAIKAELISRGMQINDPANNEAEWIEKATNAVWPKFYDSIGGKDYLSSVLRQLGRDEV